MGTSYENEQGLLKGEDHPHAYGDKSKADININYAIGSSPRVWGQVQDFSNVLTRYRIIPTRMGTSPVAYHKTTKH